MTTRVAWLNMTGTGRLQEAITTRVAWLNMTGTVGSYDHKGCMVEHDRDCRKL